MSDKKNNKKNNKAEEETNPVQIPGGKNSSKTPFNTPTVGSNKHVGHQHSQSDSEDECCDHLHTGMDINPEDFIKTLPAQVRTRVRVLQNIQDEHSQFYREYLAELDELEKKYEQKWAPLYQRRSDIVTGAADVTEDEVKKIKTEEAAEETKEEAATTEDKKGIPEFWLKAMSNHDLIAETIQEKDREALVFLSDIKYANIYPEANSETKERRQGFKLDFYFAENPFFSNQVLSKTYHLVEEDGELMLDKAEGTQIEWKEGKNLTVTTVKKKQRHKGGKNTRTVTKTEPCDSFFNFFSPPQHPDEGDEEDMDEEMAENMEDLIEADYEIGQLFKEKIIKEAVNFFTGAAISMDNRFYFNDDELEEDEEDEDSEEESGKPKKAIKGGAEGAKQGDQPECKTQ